MKIAPGADAPTLATLCGDDGYIRVTPECPAGGGYTVGNLVTLPKCDIADHKLPDTDTP